MRLLHLVSAISSASLALAWTTYVVPHSEGNDDTPALAAAFAADPKLATDTTILFKQGVTYNILTPIVFPRFENVIVSIQGNLTYAADIQATQGEDPETRRREFLTLLCCFHVCQRLSHHRYIMSLLSEIRKLTKHLVSRRVSQDIGSWRLSSANHNLTHLSQVCFHRRFQRHVGRLQGSSLGMGGFSWTAGQGQAARRQRSGTY